MLFGVLFGVLGPVSTNPPEISTFNDLALVSGPITVDGRVVVMRMNCCYEFNNGYVSPKNLTIWKIFEKLLLHHLLLINTNT